MPRRRAFTLLELLVVVAILAVLVGLSLAGVQAARASAGRLHCASNLRQFALAAHNYHAAHRALPYARKADVPDAYTWYQALLPYLEQEEAARLAHTRTDPARFEPWGDDAQLAAARRTAVKVAQCPADFGPVLLEGNSPTRARQSGSYRGCVGAGDLYGGAVAAGDVGVGGCFVVAPGQRPAGPVVPFHVRLEMVTDGTSETVLFSEGLVGTDPGAAWGGPLGDIAVGNMGGSLFTAALPPNARSADRVQGPCPQDVGNPTYAAPCLAMATPAPGTFASAHGSQAAARSRHRAGVNAAFADGSVRFVSSAIAPGTWRALGTRGAGDDPDNPPAPPARTGPLKILFLGNSYTEGNNLPELIASLARAGGERPLEIGRHIHGGYTLEQHYTTGGPAMIRSRDWEVVVLQEQSMRPIVDRRGFLTYGRLLADEVHGIDGKVLLYMTWARKHLPQTQAQLTDAYNALAGETGAEVAPVGVAWQLSYAALPGLNLHTDDNSHPNPAGSYLAACTFYAKLFGKTPVGLPGRLTDAGGGAIVEVPPATANHLQRMAWDAVQRNGR